MSSAPTSPSDQRQRDLLETRSNSPAFSNRSASPGVLRKRRSQSSRSDDTSRNPVRQTKSSNIRRANSMLLSSSSPSSPSSDQGMHKARTTRRPVQRSDTTIVPASANRPTRRPNTLADTLNNNTVAKGGNHLPLRKQRYTPVTLISIP